MQKKTKKKKKKKDARRRVLRKGTAKGAGPAGSVVGMHSCRVHLRPGRPLGGARAPPCASCAAARPPSVRCAQQRVHPAGQAAHTPTAPMAPPVDARPAQGRTLLFAGWRPLLEASTGLHGHPQAGPPPHPPPACAAAPVHRPHPPPPAPPAPPPRFRRLAASKLEAGADLCGLLTACLDNEASWPLQVRGVPASQRVLGGCQKARESEDGVGGGRKAVGVCRWTGFLP